MRGKLRETASSAEPTPEPEFVASPEAASASRRVGWMALAAATLLLLIVGAVAATPYWGPAVMKMLPWGTPAQPQAAAKPAPDDDALAARVAALEAQVRVNPSDAALQALGKRVSALEARPGPDLTPLQNELTALAASVADLTQKVGLVDKTARAAPADGIAAVLLLLQIREAVEAGRPFDPEYQALVAVSRAHSDIAAAAAPLAQPAKSGVASRAVLAARLHQLAPQIAAAAAPAASGWRLQIVARLRSLVTIRRTDGVGQSPTETAVSTAERSLAGGDLRAAIDALAGLSGANLAAAQSWLGMARQRLLVETTLRQVETLITVELGGSSAAPAKPG
jgi:hypothetical protein